MNDFYVEDLYAQKVADVSDVPVEYILKLRDIGLLDIKKARNMLLRYDCTALLKTKKFTAPQVYEYLGGVYNLRPTLVQSILNLKSKRILYCRRCGSEVTKTTYRKNIGLCGRCLSQSTSFKV